MLFPDPFPGGAPVYGYGRGLPFPSPFRPWKVLQPLRGPVGLEIGFGDGRFLVVLARENPDLLWVGMEVSGHAVQQALRRIRREKLWNVILLKGDARLLLKMRFRSGSVREAYINFPDPWPKKRHASRRLVEPGFFRLLASRMIPGGEVQIASDHPAIWEGMEAIRDLPFVEVIAPREGPRTKYEAKWLRQGKPIRKVRYRILPPLPDPPRMEEERLMDHRVLPAQALDRLDRIPEGEPVHLTRGVLKVLRCYRRSRDGLVFALVVDHTLDLRQTVWFDLHPYREDQILLGVVHSDQVLVTPAVLEALDWIAGLLRG